MGAAVRLGLVASTLLGAGAWLGCNALFNIGEPVLEQTTGSGGQAPSGSTSGSGGNATTSASSGSSATGGNQEDCFDGVDNDGNGFIDCADPACQVDYGCAVDAEVGWNGLFYTQEITYNPAGAPPAPCPDGKLPAIYYAAPSPAECTSCNCDLKGAVCTAPMLQSYIHGGCDDNTKVGASQSTTTACGAATFSDVGTSMKIIAPASLVTAGTCTATGGTLGNPDPWGQEVRLCAAPAGKGCSAGKSCVKKAPSGFLGEVCITQAGSAACPSGWADHSVQVYGGGTDGRACAACPCDTSTVTCAGGKYTIYKTATCTPLAGFVPIDVTAASGCASTPGPDDQRWLLPELGTPTGLTCGAAKAIGAVVATGDTRVCCRQMSP